jgi:hypothetical protein
MKANVIEVRYAFSSGNNVDLPKVMEFLAKQISPDYIDITEFQIVGLQLLHSAPIEPKVSNLDPSSPFSKH